MATQVSLASSRFIRYDSCMSSQGLPEALPTLEGFDAAVGFTVQQHLFSLGITRARLGVLLGVPGQSVSSRLRGKVRWTAGDLAVAAEVFGVGVADLYPARSEGGWVPAPYVPGTSKAPVPSGAEAAGGTPGQHQSEQLATPAHLP